MPDTAYCLRGKKALVTGGNQGIGQGIALRLAAEGCDVVITFRKNQKAAEDTKRQIESQGGRVAVVQADVSQIDEAQRLIDEAFRALGTLDFLVNNAGVEIDTPFLDVKAEDYFKVVAVNMTGPFFLTQFFVRRLRDAHRSGKVVNISSVHEDLPYPRFAAYGMAKGGLKMMMRTLSIELAPLGITINNIAPGAIKTPINADLMNDEARLKALTANIPLARLGEPSDVAGLCAFLLSSDADYITGSSFFVDGGLTWNYNE
jgi:glucose 1-dehydrogenase